MESNNNKETLWLYFKYSTGTTRATLREHIDDKCSYVDDKATTDLAATIYKAWVEKEGSLSYPPLLILPRGVYLSDGSGSSFGEDAERDVSYHRVDEVRAKRIMFFNGDTLWQSLKAMVRAKWQSWKYKVISLFLRQREGACKDEAPPRVESNA